MAKIKVYTKKGRTNYKENKLIDAIRDKIVERQAKDPNFTVEPATSFEQLKSMHDSLVAEDATFEEMTSSATGDVSTEQTSNMSDETEEIVEAVEETAGREFVDPFNRENPIVREYVLGEDDYPESADAEEVKEQPSSFDEPLSEEDAFKMEDQIKEEEEAKASSGSSEEGKKEEKKKDEPMNPAFDQMSTKKKKRATERFAKHIVAAVCTLAEKGFVYWTTRKINEAKLVEYSISGEVDLSILLELEGGQEMTVKEFFQGMNMQAEELSKISKEDREDLTEALVEVLMEKGFAPSPSQNLAIVGLSIASNLVLSGFMMNQQINSVIRLASPHTEENAQDYVVSQPEPVTQEPAQEEYNAESAPPVQDEGDFNALAEEVEETEGVIEAPIEEENLLLEESPVETKE